MTHWTQTASARATALGTPDVETPRCRAVSARERPNWVTRETAGQRAGWRSGGDGAQARDDRRPVRVIRHDGPALHPAQDDVAQRARGIQPRLGGASGRASRGDGSRAGPAGIKRSPLSPSVAVDLLAYPDCPWGSVTSEPHASDESSQQESRQLRDREPLVPLVRFVVNRFGWVNSVRHPKATNTAASPSIKNALDHRATANFSETHNFMPVPYFPYSRYGPPRPRLYRDPPALARVPVLLTPVGEQTPRNVESFLGARGVCCVAVVRANGNPRCLSTVLPILTQGVFPPRPPVPMAHHRILSPRVT